jgi:hypothetical protein
MKFNFPNKKTSLHFNISAKCRRKQQKHMKNAVHDKNENKDFDMIWREND